MQIECLEIAGPLLITPRRFGDARGWFSETWNPQALAQAGADLPDFVQDNHSYSQAKGTLRGLHYQSPPMAQAKLVRCTRGAIFDVAVDIRTGSPNYGQWVGARLDAQTGAQLFVPEGFLHGFLTLVDDCEVQYKCSRPYSPAHDGAVAWDSCRVDWPLAGARPNLSPKDADATPLADFSSPFHFAGQP